MAKLRVEGRARRDWDSPKRTACSTPRIQRAARRAGSAAPSYTKFPKLCERLPIQPDLTKSATDQEGAMNRENPKLDDLLPVPLGLTTRPTQAERAMYRDKPKRCGVSERTTEQERRAPGVAR